MNKKLLLLFLAFAAFQLSSAQKSSLTVEKIMQDPSWMGTFPSNIRWGVNSENIYFDYNPEKNREDSLYKINIKNLQKIEEVHGEEQQKLIPSGDYNHSRAKKVYVKNGILSIYDLEKRQERELLELGSRVNDPVFLANENLIAFSADDNAFIYDLELGTVRKITDFRSGNEKEDEDKLSEKDKWLRDENLKLLNVVREREENKENSEAYREMLRPEPYTFYAGKKRISQIKISPQADFVTFNLITRGEEEGTKVPNYVDASGYTVELPARSKVGDENYDVALAIYNVKEDSVYMVKTEELPGISELPDYVKDYPDKEWIEEPRDVVLSETYFSDDGEKAVVNIRSKDNKDRWIAQIDLQTGALKPLERQRDEAWIAGPGIGWTFGGGTLGWLPDNKHIYFQSEESGYSHLYLLNTETGKKKQLTKGEYEVFDPFLSNNGKFWYFTSSEVHPGERHFYKMPVMGGKAEKLTSMTGNNEVSLSPDEKYMAIRHSYSNEPWELYLKKTSSEAKAEKLTSGQSEAFKSYAWRDPELVQFKAEDGTMVPARLYKPAETAKNNAAIVFVHGAGYLQNVHKWWSSYFREYMFNNLLADLGYTVIDVDYRGSSGYGRDWRTAIYRNMGGKDLSDQVDAVEYLVAKHGIDPEKVGIYGGSYGGFITLMALFKEPETFKSGAALRAVTDWAHYNHGYTANILNEPSQDPIAYRRSSPIYFAEGFKGNLLMAHGMVDTNVHFQDVVRLAQRLIELKKEDWELAVYPVESHGFVEPTSWMDEYKRVLELFNSTLLDEN